MLTFLVSTKTLRTKNKESEEITIKIIDAVKKYIETGKVILEDAKLSALKEMFRKDFLTKNYFLNKFEFIYGK